MTSCLLGAALPSTWGQETASASPDWTIDNSRWTGALAPSAAIEVENQYGDVRLRAADAGEVEVSAMAQRRTHDAAKAGLAVERRGGVLRIEVRYPKEPQADLHRVDVAVFVPARARVVVRTADGMIQARGLDNDVELESAGGNVFVSTAGTAQVKAGRGDIAAELGPTSWSGSPRLTTREGDITLSLPKDADARIRIRAPGEISVQAHARSERRDARGATVIFGRGTHSLLLETQRGGVTLLAAGLS